MTKPKPSRGVLTILETFRDSEDCDGDPSRPMSHEPMVHLGDKSLAKMIRDGLAYRRGPITGFEQIQLTDSGLTLFRQAFPDHPYSRDWAESERERLARLECIVHIIFRGGHLSVNDAIATFAREYFDSPRSVESVESDWDTSARETFGAVTFAEDDNWHKAVYRFRYNCSRNVWEFRKALA